MRHLQLQKRRVKRLSKSFQKKVVRLLEEPFGDMIRTKRAFRNLKKSISEIATLLSPKNTFCNAIRASALISESNKLVVLIAKIQVSALDTCNCHNDCSCDYRNPK
jgi:hypothetical protein